MTDLATAAKPRKASRYLWALVILLLFVAVASFAGFWVARSMDVGKPVLVGILTVTGLSLEASMWATAASVGLSIFETRKRIWRLITGRGWKAE